MAETAVRANLLDASALVKLVVDEPGYEILCAYAARNGATYCTPFCLYEALSVLKAK